MMMRLPYLNEGDATRRHGDVVAELVEELGRDSQGGAAKLKLIRPETECEQEHQFNHLTLFLQREYYCLERQRQV